MAQMARRCCGESAGSDFWNCGRKARNAPTTVGRSDIRGYREALALGWQSLAKLIHQLQGFLTALVGQMQVNHGAVDLCVAEQLLDRMQMGTGLQQVSGKTVTQRVHRSRGHIELFASQD